MPQRSEYAPGTPSWVDIGTDVEPAKAFYTGLFGWEAQEAGPPEETGGYGFFTKGGLMVAGYGPQQNPGPPYWATYVSVVDADDTAKRVEAAGGTVVMAPMDVMTAGRMAVFQDPFGAYFSAWQPGDHKGAQLVNEPDSYCWNELSATDPDGSRSFYRDVFDWEPLVHEEPFPYTEFVVGDQSVAGMMQMPPGMPAGMPAFWLVYFAVDDTDAKVAKARELGGSVLMDPMDLPIGRFAVLSDPQGASFGVIRLNPARPA